jgi:GNAT superfamily N-acetyltransferase
MAPFPLVTHNNSISKSAPTTCSLFGNEYLEPLIYKIADDSDLKTLRSELNPEGWQRLAVWLEHSCTKPSWIMLNLARGALVEALVLLTHPGYGIPLECIRLFREPSGKPIDSRLFQSGASRAKICGARELFYSTPQDCSEKELIHQLGFSLWREVYCYKSTGHVIAAVADYRWVEAEMFPQSEVISLIERTSEASDDSQTKYYLHALGSYADAKLTLETMQLASHDRRWWLVALGADGQQVGLVLPVLEYGELKIGFIGVVPDQRGRGIAAFLLKQLLPILKNSGYPAICADVDRRNRPMQRALVKSGFNLEHRKLEWRLTL